MPRTFAALCSVHVVMLFLNGVGLWAAELENKPKHRPGGVSSEYAVRTFKGAADAELRYGWLTPEKIESGQTYPLVLCLHGRSGNARSPSVLAEDAMRQKYSCFVLVPECDQSASWASSPAFGRGEKPEKLPLVIEALRSLMKTEPIDSSRVYVIGQSMGGVGTWAAAARYPELFAAAVPVCGAWDVADASNMVNVPIWAFHGDKDPTVPVRFSRELTEAVKKAGGTVKYTEYPDVGHDSWSATYSDAAMWQWLFAQRKTP